MKSYQNEQGGPQSPASWDFASCSSAQPHTVCCYGWARKPRPLHGSVHRRPAVWTRLLDPNHSYACEMRRNRTASLHYTWKISSPLVHDWGEPSRHAGYTFVYHHLKVRTLAISPCFRFVNEFVWWKTLRLWEYILYSVYCVWINVVLCIFIAFAKENIVKSCKVFRVTLTIHLRPLCTTRLRAVAVESRKYSLRISCWSCLADRRQSQPGGLPRFERSPQACRSRQLDERCGWDVSCCAPWHRLLWSFRRL